MSAAEIWEKSAEELCRSYRKGSQTPEGVLDALLDRIGRLDAEIGAFTFLAPEEARRAAAESAERYRSNRPASPLDGVPVGVKEIFDVAGWPSTGGSMALAERVATADSTLVSRLRAGGAVLIGLTRSHEMALGITTQHETRGSTRNPWNLSRIPGGSSGGSGAAVAAGLVPLAVASDTSGSVRIPAAFCGVCGIRPTHGRLPLDGVLPLAPSYDAAGFIAREVGDLVMATELAGPKLDPIPADIAGLRIGVARESALPSHPAISASFEEARRVVEDLGASVVEVDLPPNSLLDQAALAQIAEMVHTHTRDLATWPERQSLLGRSLRDRLEMMVGLGLDHDAGADALQDVRRQVASLEVDLLLDPSSNRPPSTVQEPEPDTFLYEVLRSNHLQAFVGAPSVSVPAGLDDQGLPVGVQIWSHPGNDALVLGAAGLLREGLRHRLPDGPPLQ